MLGMDARTLLFVAVFNYFAMGTLTLLAATYGRHAKALAWCALAGLMGGLAFGVFLYRYQVSTSGYPIWLSMASNGVLLTSYACLWASLRSFVDKPVHWLGLLAAAAIWLGLLLLWPEFSGDKTYPRVVVFSLLTIAYMVACFLELGPCWRTDRWQALPVFAILLLHSLFFVGRLYPYADTAHYWLQRPDFTVTVFENILFIICITYAILVLVRAHSEHRYEYMAQHDQLTGLANRRVLFELGPRRLKYLSGKKAGTAALMCDLDNFKQINDQYGHDVGDQVLSLFADVLRRTVRKTDLCVRFGGEEFVVLADRLDEQTAHKMAERIRQALQNEAGTMPCPVSVSIGLAHASPMTTARPSLEDLLLYADKALYRAKTAGRNRVCTWREQKEPSPTI